MPVESASPTADPVHLPLDEEGADPDTTSVRVRVPLPADTRIGGRRTLTVRRKMRKKSVANMDWRLMDSEFDKLHGKFRFDMEACCDPAGLNGHAGLPYCSSVNSLLDTDVTGKRLFVNPPWKLAHQFVQHVRRCHAKDPGNTVAVIVLPKWPTFDKLTKDLTLFKEIPAWHSVFTRSAEDDSSQRLPVTPAKWPVQYWVMDASTPVLQDEAVEQTVPPAADANVPPVEVPPNVPPEDVVPPVDSNGLAREPSTLDDLKSKEAAAKWLPTAAAYTILDPNHPEALMKIPITFNGLETEALIDNAATLNFVSGDFVTKNGIKWRSAGKIGVRVANAQRISSTRVVKPDNLIINGKDYSGVSFRVLSMLKAADVILGLPAQKHMEMTINPSKNAVFIAGEEVSCVQEPRRVACNLIDDNALAKLVKKATRAKTPIADFFVVEIKEAVEEAAIKSDFGPEFDEKLQKLVDEYQDVTAEFVGLPPSRGEHDHSIKLTGEPPRQRRSRLSHPEFEELKRQCTEYFAHGRVRVSTSPYAAPVILVRKADGSMRLCVDYRGLNTYTVKDAYPLPRIDELLDQLRRAKVLTHLDLQQGYHQIRMAEDSIAATAFQGVTPSGSPSLLEFLVMPFGLCSAPSTFQKLMNRLLEPYINKCVLVYLDDVCIYSSSLTEHLEHLALVLQILRENKLHIKLKKCSWAKKETEYLGVIAGNGCLRPSPAKIAAVQNWPMPTTPKQVKSFVAFCSFYRKFVHHFSDIATPLIDMYSGERRKTGVVVWTDDAKVAFETLKARLTSAPVLLIPVCGPESEFVVATDASDVGLGACLLQKDDHGDLRPCAYYARKLNSAERSYSAYDKEALAVVESVHRAWRVYLEGCRSFQVVTDHSTLTHLLTQPSTNLTKRQARFVEKLMPYAGYMKILYRKGKDNEADPVSRRPDFYSIWWDGEVPKTSAEADFLALHAESISMDEVVRQQLLDGYAATQYFNINDGRWRHDKLIRSDDGLFYYHGRIVIPRPAQELRRTLLREYHDQAGHPGWKRLMAKLMTHYWWKGIMHDCKDYVAKCVVCNRAKPDRRGAAPVNPLPVPEYPWQVVGVDYVTGLPPSGKQKYTAVMIVVCHLTKMAHFIPCKDDVTAEQSAEMFVHNVYRLHGVPRVLVSDRDSNFTSSFWQALWRRLDCKLNMSTARRPQTDGLTERVNGTMQSLLRCYCAEAGYDWASHLDMVEFSYNSFVNEAGKHSPFEANIGFVPPAPVDLMLPLTNIPASAAARLQSIKDTQLVVRQLLQLSKERLAAKGNRPAIEFQVGDHVYVATNGLNIKSQACKKLRDRKIGPFRVLERIGGRAYKLELPNRYRLHNVFHVDVLSKAISEEPLRPGLIDVSDDREIVIEDITEVKLDRWPGLRGLRVQFLVKYADEPDYKWALYESDDPDGIEGAAKLDQFLKTQAWNDFVVSKRYAEFAAKYPTRAVQIHGD